MTDNTWLKIIIETDPLLVESIGDFLIGVIEAGVETGAPDEPHYGTVTGFVQKPNLSREEVDDILARISGFLGELADIFNVALPELNYTVTGDEDWGKNWKDHFKPFAIVPGLVISPSWEEYQPEPGVSVITMDPGMAFGTGHHATTSLCLSFVQKSLKGTSGWRLLDVGTGTGILGMAGLLFGAEKVIGVDNDPEAVAAASKNVVANGLEGRMQVSSQELSTIDESYEIVIANIVHDVLVALSGDLARVTADTGTLILSGLLTGTQVENIIAVFGTLGFRLVDQAEKLEWSALKFKKGPSQTDS
ncbi:MAG: 50S ribosomal protein L11 methyltransferase [Desulforhopalus sp.]